MWLFRRNKKSEADAAVEKDVEKLQGDDSGLENSSAEAPAEEFAPDAEDGKVKAAVPAGTIQPEHIVSEKEKALLAEMKDMLDPALLPGVPLDVGLDWTLLRFLRARKGDIPAALEAYKAMLEWRRENKVDEMLTAPDPKEYVFQCVCPHRHHGTDREGHPVYYERTGMIRVGEVLRHMNGEEDIVTRHVRFMEHMIQRMIDESQRQEKYIGKMVIVHDLTGMKYTIETAGMRIFRRTTHIDQTYYPECLHRMLIINAPMSFRGVWLAIRPWLDPQTRAKVEILGSNYHARLAELVDSDNLPSIFGGNCKCDGVYHNGDSCFAPVRVVQVDDAATPPPWAPVSRAPTDLEGGSYSSPIAPTQPVRVGNAGF
jgi:hypothetical protein